MALPKKEMTRFEFANCIFKIDGYFMFQFHTSDKQRFEDGRTELIAACQKEIEHIKKITFEQFMDKRKKI
jgi:hypothetical protein